MTDHSRRSAVVVLAALAVCAVPGLAAAATPFGSFEGTWSGGGRIVLDGGSSERLSCRASYNPRSGGSSLGMSIRCASASYKIELRASLVSSGSTVSGSWEERTFNAGGSVTGRNTGSALNLSFKGNVSGAMSVNVGGRQQRVSITSNGGGFQSVSISLSKS